MPGPAPLPLRRLLQQHGGTFAPGNAWTPPSHSFRFRERPCVLTLSPQVAGGEGPSAWCRFDIDLRGVSPGVLKIFPEGFFTPIAKLFGAQDLRIGDAAFDALYVVKATPPSLAASVFGGPRRTELLAAVRALGRYLQPVVDLSRDRLRLQVAQEASEVLIDRLLDAGGELLGAILAAAPGAAPLWDAVMAPAAGRCPVCGTPLQQGLLRCGTCRTPHHRECWDYAGGCSTYACGGKHSVG